MQHSERSVPIDSAVDVDLERAFRALIGERRHSTAATLRHAIWAYVDVAKGRGLPPERVIVGIKEVADRAGIVQASESHVSGAPFTTRDEALRHAVTWCIERYYGDDARQSG